jgi:hypothetical protein
MSQNEPRCTESSHKKAERRREIRGGRVSVNEKKKRGDVKDMMCTIPNAVRTIFDVFPLKQNEKASLCRG